MLINKPFYVLYKVVATLEKVNGGKSRVKIELV